MEYVGIFMAAVEVLDFLFPPTPTVDNVQALANDVYGRLDVHAHTLQTLLLGGLAIALALIGWLLLVEARLYGAKELRARIARLEADAEAARVSEVDKLRRRVAELERERA